MIRISEIPSLQPTRINAAPMDPRAAAAPARALGDLGQGLLSVSGAFTKIVGDVQNVVNARDESRIRLGWSESLAAHEQKLQAEQNPEVRRSKTDELLHKLKGTVDTPGIAPVVRNRLLVEFDEFATKTRIDAGGNAARLAVKQADDATQAEWSQAMNRNDRDGAAKVIESRKAYGLLTPGEEKQMWANFDRNATLTNLATLIHDSPLEARDLLRDKEFVQKNNGVSESDRLKYLEKAELEISGLQRDSLRKISDRIEAKDIVSDEELEEAMGGNPFLDESYKDELRFNFAQRQPVDAETRFGLTDELNALHDAYSDGEITLDEYRQIHDSISNVVYSLGARDGSGALRQRVHALDPANWDSEGRLREGDKMKSLMRGVEKMGALYQEQGAFGSVDEDESPAARAEKAVAVLQARERVEKRVGNWIAQHKDQTTDEEVSNQFRKEYMAEFTTGILAPTPPSAAARRNALEELAGGPKGARDNTPQKPIGKDLVSIVKDFEAGGEPEGFHRQAYWDQKQWSIGYGTRSKQGEVIDQPEAEKRLNAELGHHRQRVEEAAEKIGMELLPHELDALTSFDFNTGRIDQLLAGGTRSKQEIASKMLLYRNSNGKRFRGLERRRIAEAHLFRQGYPKASQKGR